MKRLLPYAATALLSLVAVTFVLKLWHLDFSVPLSYDGAYGFVGDTLLGAMVFKTVLEHGWFLQNPSLGAPMGLALQDFPLADGFHFLLVKVIGLFSSNIGIALNVFFLLTFVLTPLAALYAMRAFKVSTPVAMVASVLYTFLPYHFLRGGSHLLLSAYYSVPLMVYLALRAWDSPAAFGEQGRPGFSWRGVGLFLVCLVAGSTGIYYAFFGCFFIAIAAVMRALQNRQAKALIPGLVLVAMILGGVALNLAPSVVYRSAHGRNQQVAARSPVEAEIYGLKMTQLVLPLGGHRIPLLAKVSHKYDDFPLPNEGSETLGLIGSLGFASLLLLRLHATKRELSDRLSILNLSGVLLATVGGFSSLFAMYISPEIRAYNRISVFLAFFCLFEVALLLDALRRRLAERPLARHAVYPGLAVLMVGGLLDQTTPFFVPNYEAAKKEFTNDHAFVQAIEARVPANSRIFQLPAVPFPEEPPVNKMADYELFRGYMHSSKLQWSYGAMKGRTYWAQRVAAAPMTYMLPTLAREGFQGIYLDRFGYTDNGQGLEAQLKAALGVEPIVSENGRLAFYPLDRYLAAHKASPSKELATYWDLVAALEPSAEAPVKAKGSLEQFEALHAAARQYLAQGGTTKDLCPLVAEQKGFLPGYFGGNAPPAGDWNWTVMRGWLGGWDHGDYAVGVEGTPEMIAPVLETYGQQAKQVFYPYPQVLTGKPAPGTSGQLLLVFEGPKGGRP